MTDTATPSSGRKCTARADSPKTNRDKTELRRKGELLDAPRIKPLSDFVRQLRTARPNDWIPWFDPTEAGNEARILRLGEAPGPGAVTERGGSGFVSPDNNDQSASSMWSLLKEAGVERCHEIVAWNVIPWYIGSDRKIRPPHGADIRDAKEPLLQLLRLLPEVKVVVLLGKTAAAAWESVAIGIRVIHAPHPSPQNLNTHPENRLKILTALRDARAHAGYIGANTHLPVATTTLVPQRVKRLKRTIGGKGGLEAPEDTIARVETPFMRSSVTAIEEWLRGVGYVVTPGSGGRRNVHFGDTSVMRYAFTTTWVYVRIFKPSTSEIATLREKLTDPTSINRRADGSCWFHISNATDFEAFKAIAMARR